jgi:hypothetical protein
MTATNNMVIHPKDCMCTPCVGFRLGLQQSQQIQPTAAGVGTATAIPNVRSFETGATRSPDAARYDPEGFLSPLVIERYCEYMNKHRLQSDGKLRDSDNWQKGMPLETYAKGEWRHHLHFWTRHRGFKVTDAGATASIEEDLCAIMFNVMGYLHETLKAKNDPTR